VGPIASWMGEVPFSARARFIGNALAKNAAAVPGPHEVVVMCRI
jgi:hypothetical protein